MIVVVGSHEWSANFFKELKLLCDNDFSFVTEPSELVKLVQEHSNIERIFFPHWSFMVPQEIVSKFECIGFHMTDLPYGRGGSPLQNLILRGFTTTTMCALRYNDKIDDGPVYCRRTLSLNGSAAQIFERAALIMADMAREIIHNNLQAIPQSGKPVFFKRRNPTESEITSQRLNSIEDLYNFIRMLDAPGYPRAFFNAEFSTFEFSDAVMDEDGELRVTIKRRLKP